jgi:CHRD domain
MLHKKSKRPMLAFREEGLCWLPRFAPPSGRNDRTPPMIRLRSVIAAFATAMLLATGSAAFATTISFKAELNGAGEVPPVNSRGTATLMATLDTETKTLTWTASHSGLSGAPIGAHFHGPVSYVGLTSEQNAPIQVGTPGSLASGFKGSTTITDTQAKDLRDGRWYFNIHTQAHPDGEVRGPIIRTD